MREQARGLIARYRRNIDSIVARCHRVKARQMVRSGPSRSELLFLAAFLGVVVLLVGLAFDRVAVERSRTVPGVVDGFFGFISEMGKSQWELFPAGILVLILLAGCWTIVPPMVRVFWAQFGAFAFFLFASIGGAGIFVNIVKQFIGRGRPMTFELFGPFTLEPFRFVYDFQSFPSGHSATGGALIAFGFLVLRRWRLGLLLFGLAIAASRVVVGAHYPSDILAGLLVGYTFSIWLAYRFARYGWAFSLDPAGIIRARVAGLRRGFSRPGRATIVLAGLADALIGRPVWLPELKPIGAAASAESKLDRNRANDE